MPVSKNALIRYKTIDRCLRNRYRRWTLEDLIEACSDALYEFEGRSDGVSRRTVQLDIQTMRSEKLGYNAPIKVVDNKYYIYTDPDFSITESPMAPQDLEKMEEAVKVLKQLSGFREFAGMDDILGRLEDRLNVTREKSKPVIFFDKNDNLKGLGFITTIYSAISSGKTLSFIYQGFKARNPNTIVFFPYALKEFNNRWFVFGRRKGNRHIQNLALDRIISLETAENIPYEADESFSLEEWLKDMVGVTRTTFEKPHRVVFYADKDQAPYINTKPIHRSQKILKRYKDGSMIFQIKVILNQELARMLFSYAEGVRVLAPRNLEYIIKKRFALGGELYNTRFSPPEE